jgi:putative zinc finger/helix-turn-helix YgiT family protein
MPGREEMNENACPVCATGKLTREVSDFKSRFVDDNGQEHDVLVPGVTKYVCDRCGEYILDSHSESRISEAQRRAMGLLTASELQNFRTGALKTQEEIAALLGLGKKTWCRWESDDYFQSEAFDRYLRLLIEVPSNLKMLELIRRNKAPLTAANVRVTFVYIEKPDDLEEYEQQFTAMLRAGITFTPQEV